MQAMSAMEIKQSSFTALTAWIGFHAGHVSNGYQAEQGHSTHHLDGISCRPCQQWISSRAAAQHSPPGWDFMQAMSAMDIKQSSGTALTFWMGFHAGHISNEYQAEQWHSTHILDGISCRQCQKWKSSRAAAQHSLTGWDFMQAMSAMEIKQSRSTALTRWMGFHEGHVSNGYQAEPMHSTHSLDGISCKPCQQWKSSRAVAQHSQPDGISCRPCQQWKSSRAAAQHSQPDGISCRPCQQWK